MAAESQRPIIVRRRKVQAAFTITKPSPPGPGRMPRRSNQLMRTCSM